MTPLFWEWGVHFWCYFDVLKWITCDNVAFKDIFVTKMYVNVIHTITDTGVMFYDIQNYSWPMYCINKQQRHTSHKNWFLIMYIRLIFCNFSIPLLSCCNASWYHLFADIIYRLNGLQLGCNCNYALCVILGATAPRLLLYLFRIVHIWLCHTEWESSQFAILTILVSLCCLY